MTTDLAVLDEAVRHTVKISRISGGITILDYGAIRREYYRLLAERDREKRVWASERSDSFVRAAKLARAIHARQQAP